MSLDRVALRVRSKPSCCNTGRVSGAPDKRKPKPSSAKPSPAGKALRDPEIIAWLNEAVAYMLPAEDRMPDPVTRLGFADTLAWGVKTLRTSSPLSSLFDPALSPPTNDQQPFTNYARLSGNPDMRRTTWPSSTALSACSSSSSSFPQLSTISSSPSPACDGNDSTTTTMSTSTTSSNPTIYLVKVLQKLKNDYYAAGGDGRTALVKAGDDAAKDSGDVLPSGRFRACASLVAQRGNATLLAPMCEHSMQ